MSVFIFVICILYYGKVNKIRRHSHSLLTRRLQQVATNFEIHALLCIEQSKIHRKQLRPSSKRRSSHAPNLMPMSSNKGFCSFTLGSGRSAHEKSDV